MECPFCRETISSQFNLTRHINRKHPLETTQMSLAKKASRSGSPNPDSTIQLSKKLKSSLEDENETDLEVFIHPTIQEYVDAYKSVDIDGRDEDQIAMLRQQAVQSVFNLDSIDYSKLKSLVEGGIESHELKIKIAEENVVSDNKTYVDDKNARVCDAIPNAKLELVKAIKAKADYTLSEVRAEMWYHKLSLRRLRKQELSLLEDFIILQDLLPVVKNLNRSKRGAAKAKDYTCVSESQAV